MRVHEIAQAARELSPEAVETLLSALGDDSLAQEVRDILAETAREEAARKARATIAKKVGDDGAEILVSHAERVAETVLFGWVGPAREKSEMSKTYKFSRAVNVTVAHPITGEPVLVKFDVQTLTGDPSGQD